MDGYWFLVMLKISVYCLFVLVIVGMSWYCESVCWVFSISMKLLEDFDICRFIV